MSAFSDYMENSLINWLRGTAFPAVPSNFYIALFTTATDDGGAGTEVTGGSYARVALSPVAGSWTAPTGGTGATSINTAVVFPVATASWGTVSHFALMDAASGGNMIVHGPVTTAKAIGNNDTAVFAIGSLTLTFA